MSQPDDPEIRYEFDYGGGTLEVECQREDFQRIRDAILAALPSTRDRIPPLDGIRHIVIRDTTEETPPSFLRDRLVLLGCAIVGFVLLTGIAILFLVIVRAGL
ncbi:hypothetical protein [Planctomyces sp. SH-PL14]|uniref:hypothetical protein n=1 Tax=Planctomyces sp. SH-PL14 TaxID=1632864 RepID=UPI00078CCA9C|nr:hypothetical protein [Planctomyces sp. SH-PL14]AMV20947.1 hypothetical protein VT03_23800 [Planctomyces sp. SH-PL14]